MTMHELTEFFGWMSLFHFISLLLVFVVLTLLDDFVYSIHEKLFKIERSVLKPMYLKIMGQYKVLFIVFAFAPYLALKAMGY